MISKQVLVIIKELQMRRGKQIAQGAHASLLAYKTIDKNTPAFIDWNNGSFTKIAVSIDTTQELLDLVEKGKQAGIHVVTVIDAGRTEFNFQPTLTCAAFGPAWDIDLDPITGHLKLL